jgi:uncharacterized membrane protein YadS
MELFFTILTIFGTLILGYFIGKWLKINGKTSELISSGTAICGGSAISAVASAIRAKADETSVSLGTIFVLNSVIGASLSRETLKKVGIRPMIQAVI